MRLAFSILGLSVLVMPLAYGQVLGRNYGRSIVISQQGIAATSQVLASQLAQHPKDDEPRQRIEDQKRGRGTGEGAEGADDDQ